MDSGKEAETLDAKERIKFRIGFSRMEKKYEWKDHLIFMGLLLGLAVWVNRGIEIKIGRASCRERVSSPV